MNLVILLAALFLIVTESFYEGFKMRGKRTISARIEFLYLAVVSVVFFAFLLGIQTPFVYHFVPLWNVIIGYVFLRFAIFNLILNTVAGLKLSFVGTTKDTDKIMQWLMSKGVPRSFIAFSQFIAFLWGVSWLIY